jgi:hypothetical protein
MFSRQFLLFLFVLALVISAAPAKAVSLAITYNGDQNQTVQVQATTFATAIFTGSITNVSSRPVTFQLSGGPVPFEPFVASFQSGIPFPGVTLGPGATTGFIDLAIVKINPFDPSLTYPGLVNIVLPAIDPHTGTILSGSSGNTATLLVVATPDSASSFVLLAISLLGLGVFSWSLGRQTIEGCPELETSTG